MTLSCRAEVVVTSGVVKPHKGHLIEEASSERCSASSAQFWQMVCKHPFKTFGICENVRSHSTSTPLSRNLQADNISFFLSKMYYSDIETIFLNA